MSRSVDAANALLQRGDLSAALTAFESLLVTAPDDVVVLAGYASALRRSGMVMASTI